MLRCRLNRLHCHNCGYLPFQQDYGEAGSAEMTKSQERKGHWPTNHRPRLLIPPEHAVTRYESNTSGQIQEIAKQNKNQEHMEGLPPTLHYMIISIPSLRCSETVLEKNVGRREIWDRDSYFKEDIIRLACSVLTCKELWRSNSHPYNNNEMLRKLKIIDFFLRSTRELTS